jgi:hypothetical protein
VFGKFGLISFCLCVVVVVVETKINFGSTIEVVQICGLDHHFECMWNWGSSFFLLA